MHSNQQMTENKTYPKYCNVRFATTAHWNLTSMQEYRNVMDRWISSDESQGTELPLACQQVIWQEGTLPSMELNHGGATILGSYRTLIPDSYTWALSKVPREKNIRNIQCHTKKESIFPITLLLLFPTDIFFLKLCFWNCYSTHATHCSWDLTTRIKQKHRDIKQYL